MLWASKVLVELIDVGELERTEVTLVASTVPSFFSGFVGGGRGKGRSTGTVGDHLGLVGDHPITIPLSDVVIDVRAGDTGFAGTGFQVSHNGGDGDVFARAVGAFEVLGLVDRGVEVGVKVCRGVEVLLAGNTEVVHCLSMMLKIGESLVRPLVCRVTYVALVMLLLYMIPKVTVILPIQAAEAADIVVAGSGLWFLRS